MTSGSADQPTPERVREAPGRTAHEGGAARHEPEQREDFGPLELLRTRKADGRALLLFSRRRTESEQ